MEKELTLYQLGNLLKIITENYEVNLMSKIKLSGGWMTITGNIDVDYIPAEHRERKKVGGDNIDQCRQCFHRGFSGHHVNTGQLPVMTLQRKTIYLHLIHFRCNTSNQIFQIVE